jgi:DNA-directed RNA polymerase specialized sigma24 family protein
MLFQRAESDLVQSARTGDGAAFADLLQREYSTALRLAYGLLQDVDEAEDAAFTAWRRIGNLREGSSLRPWFLGIVANKCRSVKRSRWWSVTKASVRRSDAVRKALSGRGLDEKTLSRVSGRVRGRFPTRAWGYLRPIEA